MAARTRKIAGFTLIEVAVVLIVIGLLAAIILVGRHLIFSAQVIAQIRQVDQYNVAVNVFRLRYRSVPGDLEAAMAIRYGFTARSGADRHGDDDGILEPCSIGNWVAPGCEYVLIWSDLSSAKLIRGNFSAATDADVVNVPFAGMKAYVPEAHISSNAIMLVMSNPIDGTAWFVLTHYSNAPVPGQITAGPTPLQDYLIDSKIDDGKPLSGSVMARSPGNISLPGHPLNGAWTAFFPPFQGVTQCVNEDEYNVTNTDTYCFFLVIRMAET